MNNHFVVELDKSVTKLAGYDLGVFIFESQIKNKINYMDNITIEFPERVDSIASSFIQGFFKELVEELGISGIENNVNIVSSISNCKEMFIENLL